MSFTVAYNLTLHDLFTATAKKSIDAMVAMEKAAKNINATQTKSTQIAKTASAEQERHIAAMNAEKEASASITREMKQKNLETAESRRKMADLRLETTRTNNATRATVKAQNDAKRAMRESEQQMRRNISTMRDLGNKANQVGNFLLTRGTVVLGAAFMAKKSGDEFNKSMADVGSLIPGQTEKLKAYKKEVLDMAVDYAKTDLSAVAKGLYQDISNLGDSEETIKKLDIAMRSSVAGRAMEADAMNLLSGVSADYGDTSAAMMQRVSDLAFKTVELGSTTFPELAQQMGRTTTQAKTFGVSVEELFGQYAGLTSGTVRTEMVSTRLAGVFTELGKRTGPLAELMENMGAASGKDLIARFGGLQEAMFAIRREVGNDEIAFSKLFESQEGRMAALAMTGAKSKEVAEEVAKMGKAAGATELAFKEQTAGIGASAFKADQARAKFARLSVEWSDKLAPLADKLIDRFDTMVDWLSKLDDDTIKYAVTAGIWAVKIGLVSKAFGGLMSFQGGMMQMASHLNGVAGGVGATAKAAGGLQAALGGVVPVVTALVAGLATGYEIWKWLEKEQKKKVSQENNAANAFSGARGMSLEQATKKRAEMIAQWESTDTRGRKFSEATGRELLKSKHYDAVDGHRRAALESIFKLESTITEKARERARIVSAQNEMWSGKQLAEQSSESFVGQTPEFAAARKLLQERQTPNTDTIELKITTDSGATVTSNISRNESGRKFAMGSSI